MDDLVGTDSFQHCHHGVGPAKIGVHDLSHHVISLDHVTSQDHVSLYHVTSHVLLTTAVEKQGVGIVVYAQRIVA